MARSTLPARTSVTIDGARTELLFGARYRVRYGRDSKILHDAELVDRKANGDLLFAEASGAGFDSVRVRPSTIDAIFGSGVFAAAVDDALESGETVSIPVFAGVPHRLDGSGEVSYADADVRASEPDPDAPPCGECGGGLAHYPECSASGLRPFVPTFELDAELARQAEVDALVEGFVSDGDSDPDSVAAKVEAELATKRSAVVRGIAGILDGSATVASVHAELRDLADLSGESIVSPRRDGETAAAYLARLELPIPKGLGAAYTRWIETDPGQRALEDAAREVDQARTTRIVSGRGYGKKRELDAAADALVAAGKTVAVVTRDGTEIRTPKLTKAGRTKLEAAGIPTAGAETAEEAISKARGAKPYADRNQVWKCGTCKRRTRQPECANGHPAVSAPAGKRAADRLAR